MKIKSKLSIFIIIILIINLLPISVFANANDVDFDKYGMKKGIRSLKGYYKDWIEMPEKEDVPLEKKWTIKFNDTVTYDKIDGIVIVKDDDFIAVDIETTNDDKVLVTPVKSYKSDSKYTLRIFLNNGRRYFMEFHTEKETDNGNDHGIEIDFNKDNIIKVEANQDKGFYAAYYLFVPRKADKKNNSYLLVEPNNHGRSSDDPSVHEKDALELVERGFPNIYANKLEVPLLVPCFIRPRTEWRIYTHALDEDTMKVKDGKLKRIDLQLINMVEDAKEILKENGLELNEKILMSGFSASGSFTNRFTALHPEIVRAVASGGVNGMPILPIDKLDGHSLDFQIGIGNLKELTGESFDLDEYNKVAQYIYMGALDRNDTIPYRDAYSQEQADLTLELLGNDMLKERWKRSKQIYEQVGTSAQMVTYEGTTHQIRNEMIDDIVEFFEKNMEIEEGLSRIKPYEYPYVEYKELEEVHVINAYWGNDEDLADRIKDFVKDNMVAIYIEEWMDGQDYNQMRTFLSNLPEKDKKIVLKAEGHQDVTGYLNGSNFSKEPRGFLIEFSSSEMEKVVKGVAYTIHPHRSSDKYFFTVNDGVRVIRN